MKIDTTTIEGYDKMTDAEKIAALTSFEYEDNAGELDRLKNAVTKANSEAADWKRKHNALLNDDEKKQQESDEKWAAMEKELGDLRKEKTVSEHKAKFIGLGYDEALAADTAEALVNGDMTKVFANQQTFLTAHDKTLKADVLKNTPRLDGGDGSNGEMDYKKLIAEANESGDMAAMAYYTRLMQESQQNE